MSNVHMINFHDYRNLEKRCTDVIYALILLDCSFYSEGGKMRYLLIYITKTCYMYHVKITLNAERRGHRAERRGHI